MLSPSREVRRAPLPVLRGRDGGHLEAAARRSDDARHRPRRRRLLLLEHHVGRARRRDAGRQPLVGYGPAGEDARPSKDAEADANHAVAYGPAQLPDAAHDAKKDTEADANHAVAYGPAQLPDAAHDAKKDTEADANHAVAYGPPWPGVDAGKDTGAGGCLRPAAWARRGRRGRRRLGGERPGRVTTTPGDATGRPEDIGDGWPLASPEEVGLDGGKLRELGALLADWPEANVHAVVVARSGKLVMERYFTGKDHRWMQSSAVTRFGPTEKHDVRSISKSVTALLVGIALGEGSFPALGASVLGSFPEYGDLHSPEKARITFRHLLTMSAGLAWDESKPWNDPGNNERLLVEAADSLPLRPRATGRPAARPALQLQRRGHEPARRRAGARGGPQGRRIRRGQALHAARHHRLRVAPLHEPSRPCGLRRAAAPAARSGQAGTAPRGRRRVEGRSRAARGLGGGVDHAAPQHRRPPLLRLPLVAGALAARRPRILAWMAGLGNGGQRLYVVPELGLTLAVNGANYGSPLQGTIPHAILNRIVLPAVMA